MVGVRRTRVSMMTNSSGPSSDMEFLKEYWLFLKARKKLWMLPIIILLMLAASLVFLAKSAAMSPFIYTLF